MRGGVTKGRYGKRRTLRFKNMQDLVACYETNLRDPM